MKGLEALKNIKREAGTPYFSTLYDIDMWREDFAIVEKELKALEIIKSKKVNVIIFQGCNDLKEYNKYLIKWKRLTEEEFILLKEVLK